MTTLTASEAREHFSETVDRVAFGQERIVLEKRGKARAALVSMEDLALLEALEDLIDVEEAKAAIARAKAKGDKPIPWEEARRRLGL